MPTDTGAAHPLLITDLVALGFPKQVVEILKTRGFVALNTVQHLSIQSGLLDGRNQLIIAPTSSGKTLIAELAVVQHALKKKGAFYLVSLKALAEEKYTVFRDFWTQGDEPILRTAITTSDRDFEDENLSQSQVTFATYEKFFALVRDNPSFLEHVSLVVVDELQTLGDATRGPMLESLITLLRLRHPQTQLLGLSAALPNADELAAWLEATVCRTTRRDVPLIEEVWSKSTVHFKEYGQEDAAAMQERPNPTSSLETLDIVQELVRQQQTPIVVFCMTKPRTEELAKTHYQLIRMRDSALKKVLAEVKQLLLFFTEGGPTGRSLMDVVDAGIAFHHSDLSADERRVIEDKLRDGTIAVAYATTTLGQGVNLPIATVVFDDVYRRWLDTYIDRREYINMAGRAGRRGLQDEKGTAVLICRSAKDRQIMNQFLFEGAERVESALEQVSLDTLVLNLLASNYASTADEVTAFVEASLFGMRSRDHNPKILHAKCDAIPKIVKQLVKDGFICLVSEQRYRATPIGRVCSQKGLSPATGKVILTRLKTLCAALVQQPPPLSAWDELIPAIIHLFLDCDGEHGPIYEDYTAHSFLDESRAAICKLRSFGDPDKPYPVLQVAWILAGWVEGVSYQKICAPFRRLREGQIRQAAEHCGWMIDSAAAFARVRELGVDPRIAHALSRLYRRLLFGVTDPGVALMEVVRNRAVLGVELGGIGRHRVQECVSVGLTDLNSIIDADDALLLRIFRDGRIVSNLRTAIERYIERTAGSLLPQHQQRAQKLNAGDFLKAVYEKVGTDFEVAIYRLLASVGVNVELLDDKKVQGCADLLVRTAAGSVQVECKTRNKGQVSNTDAFEVLGKTVVGGQPIAFATIGKPGFADTAIKNSFDKRVALLTHKVLAEAVIQVGEGRLSQERLVGLFTAARCVDLSELRS